MPTKTRTSPVVDAYIAKAKPFAQPILKKIRALVHKHVPDAQEEMKWSSPHFNYKGMFCGMSAFNAHCIFGFWKSPLLKDAAVPLKGDGEGRLGDFRGRITSVADLPSDAAIAKLLKAARKLNDEGAKVPGRNVTPAKDRIVTVPPLFLKAIKANKKAHAAFEKFPYSHKKEYVQWVTEAKRDETRDRRIIQAVEWMAEGKSRNWKYENC